MKNRDRDDQHRRRRETGEPQGEPEEDPDGRDVARALYGGLTDREPTSEEDGTSK